MLDVYSKASASKLTILSNCRYNEAVLNHFGNNKDILEAAKLIEEWFNKFFLCLDTAKSWHDISVKGAFAFTICEGDQQLNWKDKGFKTILDVLMVSIVTKSPFI